MTALALAEPTGGHHDITGPESLDAAAIAGLAERQWGVPIKHVDVAPAEYCTELAHGGEDPWWTYAFSSMFASVREQRWAPVSIDVNRLTGRPPTPAHEILAANSPT